ncbi:MAG TPA: hypothetical protein VI756_05680, partial [Blastocatellia bacterium]
ALAVIVLGSTVAAFKSSVVYALQRQNGLRFRMILAFKSPLDYNLPPGEVAFARSVSGDLNDRVLLSPDSVNSAVALVNPSVRFEVPRSDYVEAAFANLGRRGEAARRLAAQKVVDDCDQTPENMTALAELIFDGVDAIIIHDCPGQKGAALVKTLLAEPGAWKLIKRGSGYILFERFLPLPAFTRPDEQPLH